MGEASSAAHTTQRQSSGPVAINASKWQALRLGISTLSMARDDVYRFRAQLTRSGPNHLHARRMARTNELTLYLAW